jgi:hypothetical protein
MTNPVPWNPSPNKGNPCGGATPPGTTAATYTVGASITVNWRVVAGDGNGPVSLSFAPLTGTPQTTPATGSFGSLTATTSGPTATIVATGPYTLTATLPALAPGVYAMQAKSSTDWFSCATVNITAAQTAPANNGGTPQLVSQCTPAPTPASPLGFCNQLLPGPTNQIELSANPALSNFRNYDSTVNTVYQANLASRLVFGNALNNAECARAYKRFLCAFEFPKCGVTDGLAACKSACYEFSQACDLQDSHKDLYNCAAMQITTSDSMGQCAPCTGACALTLGTSSHVSYSIAVLVSLFAGLFAARNL